MALSLEPTRSPLSTAVRPQRIVRVGTFRAVFSLGPRGQTEQQVRDSLCGGQLVAWTARSMTLVTTPGSEIIQVRGVDLGDAGVGVLGHGQLQRRRDGVVRGADHGPRRDGLPGGDARW